MTVVNELDKTLFESYVKPKATVLMGIIRGGILDSSMDWYETPQPKGMSFSHISDEKFSGGYAQRSGRTSLRSSCISLAYTRK